MDKYECQTPSASACGAVCRFFVYIEFIILQAPVVSIGLNQKDSAVERRLAVLDKNKDLFLYQVRVYGRTRVMFKLCES